MGRANVGYSQELHGNPDLMPAPIHNHQTKSVADNGFGIHPLSHIASGQVNQNQSFELEHCYWKLPN